MPEPDRVLLLGDPWRCEQALADRSAALSAEVEDVERHPVFADEADLDSLRIEVRSESLFAHARHFVIRHAETARDAKRMASLFQETLAPATFLTVVAQDLKESSPLLRVAREGEAIRPLHRLKGQGLERAASGLLAKEGVTVPPAAVRRLLLECGDDLLSLSQEAEKLRAFATGGPVDEETAARVSFAAAEASAYAFLDAIGEGSRRRAVERLSGLREEPTRTLGACVRHLARVLSARLLLDEERRPEEIAPLLGAPAWLTRRLVDQARPWETERLIALLDQAIDQDVQVKSGHVRPSDALLELALLASSGERRPAPGCGVRSGSSPGGADRARTRRTGSPRRRSPGRWRSLSPGPIPRGAGSRRR